MLGAVDQAVQDGLGQDGVGEEFILVFGGTVGDDNGGTSLVALRWQAPETEVVQDVEILPEVAAETLFPGPVSAAATEVGEEPPGLGCGGRR